MDCNWGILGPGFIATHAIIPAIQEVSNSRILAVASSNEERSREVALRFGIERFYSDYQALLDDPDVDVVYIALPNHLHREGTTWDFYALYGPDATWGSVLPRAVSQGGTIITRRDQLQAAISPLLHSGT